jgi:hypothetical protein
MNLLTRRAALSRQYEAAIKARRWKRAGEIYQELREITTRELRKENRVRKAA